MLGTIDREMLTLLANTPRLSLGTTPPSRVILSGCGTSGRLAYVLAKQHGAQYLIAGGDEALFCAKEAFEDRAEAGAADLARLVGNSETKDFFFIGISCGLSAPYVGGQIEWAMEHFTIPCAAIGFNSIASLPIFTHPSLSLFNPILGPECVTGSSRMKGGTATKIILEAAFTNSSDFSVYEAAHSAVYSATSLAVLAQHCGDALCRGDSVTYVARGAVGVLALIDASEQRPTFGAKDGDVKGGHRNGAT